MEQRYRAVLEVLDNGATVVEVARRYGVARQTVHAWLRRYAAEGLGGLADHSSRPASCPHQIPAPVEARVVALRRAHPGWGPRRILTQLRSEGVVPLPGRSSVYRALVRHGLIQPQQRRRRRQDYQRWERARAMELWQLDISGRIRLADGTQLSAVTGIDDHSRFCVLARLVERATARPVGDALGAALARHGAPQAILTDNGKVFTARFGPGPGPVLFDRLCHDHGIRHLLTAPTRPPPPARSSGCTRRCAASSSTGSCSTPSSRPNKPWTPGWSTTTPPGPTRASATGHQPTGSRSPNQSRSSLPRWPPRRRTARHPSADPNRSLNRWGCR